MNFNLKEKHLEIAFNKEEVKIINEKGHVSLTFTASKDLINNLSNVVINLQRAIVEKDKNLAEKTTVPGEEIKTS